MPSNIARDETCPNPDGKPSTVSLREAAETLRLSEAAVLMRVFHGSIQSVVDEEGARRVPREALEAGIEPEERPRGSGDAALLVPELEALAAELAQARERIAALESRAEQSPASLMAGMEALAAELKEARARISALESTHQLARPQWRRYWEAWVNPSA